MTPLFSQGAFVIDPNATPEQIARKRQMIAALMPQFGKAKYVGEGLGQLFMGIGMGRQQRRLDDTENANTQEGNNLFQRILSGASAQPDAPITINGARPAPAAAPTAPRDPNAPQSIADDTMAALGKQPMSGAGAIRAGLIQRGMPEHIADAFIMNFQDESGLNPGINEASPIVPGSRGGFGLAQWTGPRRRALEAYAQQRGADVADPNLQMDFLMTELDGPEANAAKAIFGASNSGEAAAAIVNKFLRPAEQHRSRREARYLGGATPPAQTTQTTAGGGGVPLENLYSAVANPWLNDQQRSVITSMIEQRTKAADPMTALQMQQAQLGVQKSQLELAQMQQPQPGYRVLTSDEAGAQGLPPGSYQVGPDGKISAVGGGGQTINVDASTGGGKFEEAFAKGDADTINTVYSAGLSAQRNLGRIDQLDALLRSNPTGGLAALKQKAGEFGVATDGLDDIQAAQAVINSLVPEQRQPGSGPMSDADLALFKQSLPRIVNQPGGNDLIVRTMRGIAQYDAEGAQIVQKLRAGEIDRTKAFDLLQARVNPLDGIRPIPQGGAATQTATSQIDFSQMSIDDLTSVDVNSLTPEQMFEMQRRWNEVGQ